MAPAFVLASAYVAYAQLLERDGDRARAIENYRAAADLVGGDTRARDDARAALQRLRAGMIRRALFLTFSCDCA